MGWMQEEDYHHVWTISKRSWYVRLYLAIWEADPQAVTFCKLWWGYVLLPIGLFLKVLSFPVRGMARAVEKRRSDAETKRSDTGAKPPCIVHTRPVKGRRTGFWVERSGGSRSFWKVRDPDAPDGVREFYTVFRDAKYHTFNRVDQYDVEVRTLGRDGSWYTLKEAVVVHAKPVLSVRFLEGATSLASKGIMRFGRAIAFLGKVVSFPFRTFRRAAISLAVGWLAIVAALVLSALRAEGLPSPGTVWGAVGPSVGNVASLVGIGLAVVFVDLVLMIALFMSFRSGIPQKAGKRFARATFVPVGRGAKRTGLTFRDVMRIGYVSVKGNTCPRVVVEEDEE